MPGWRPDASLATLRARAGLNADIRAFFAARGVLEVETPILSAHATVDRHIASFQTLDGRWLQTSPEFAMKRLLAAGAGPIFQIARVFRFEEQGRYHHPEFTMLEWYRPGLSMHQLMDEVCQLMEHLVGIAAVDVQRLSYRDAFLAHAGLDPHRAQAAQLREAAIESDLVSGSDFQKESIDFWLDLWMSRVVAPQLGQTAPAFIYDFPASQAALSRIRPGTPPLAERFELFWQGIELANGFHELTQAEEQRQRFRDDQAARRAAGLPVPPYDIHLIDALAAGLPDCSGVALGLDRVLMLKLGLDAISETFAFSASGA